jgi:hypothetical protein
MLTKGNPFIDDGIVADLKRGLTSSRSVQRVNGRLHASSSGACVRRNTIHPLVDKSATMNATGQIYADIGTAVHESIQKALDRAGSLWMAEYHLPDVMLEDGTNLNLGGYVDVVAVVDGTAKCVELKTTGKMPTAPKYAHRLQAQIYSVLTGLPAMLMYISRNVIDKNRELAVTTFDVPMTDEDRLRVLTHLALSTRSVLTGLVAPQVGMTRSKCSQTYCPFMTFCWGETEYNVEEMDAETYIQLGEVARQDAVYLLEDTPRRRNGMFKFWSQYGTDNARRDLHGTEWAQFTS